jgi:hypothetical protein
VEELEGRVVLDYGAATSLLMQRAEVFAKEAERFWSNPPKTAAACRTGLSQLRQRAEQLILSPTGDAELDASLRSAWNSYGRAHLETSFQEGAKACARRGEGDKGGKRRGEEPGLRTHRPGPRETARLTQEKLARQLEKTENKYGLLDDLLKAVVFKETKWNPARIYKPLMEQAESTGLLPEEAAGKAKTLKDPKKAIDQLARVLAELYQQTGGNWREVAERLVGGGVVGEQYAEKIEQLLQKRPWKKWDRSTRGPKSTLGPRTPQGGSAPAPLPASNPQSPNAGGRYQNLLRQFTVAEDSLAYGTFRDQGYADTRFWGYYSVSGRFYPVYEAGYWVYHQGTWYVWQTAVR